MNQFVWQKCLEVSEIDATGYHDGARGDLVEMLDFPPKTALDIGCSAGGTGAYLKARHPDVEVWGIELNKSAAEKAKSRIDHVLVGHFEDFDLEKEGIAPGTLDLVILADVLEHMYNPWSVLTSLKRFLSERGRIIVSIPNIRYLPLLDDLARGYWRYAEMGILDITHLRFFTLQELRRMCFETGYTIDKLLHGLDPTLRPQMERYAQTLPCNIDTGKLVIKNVDKEELLELYSGQFFFFLKAGQTALSNYQAPRMGSYFWRGMDSDYNNLLNSHRVSLSEAAAFDHYLEECKENTVVEIIVLSNSQTLPQLSKTINSLASQYYHNVRISIAGEGDCPQELRGNTRISWLNSNGQHAETINKYLNSSNADWIGVLEAGDQLIEHSLLYLLDKQQREPEIDAIYFDEDQLGEGAQPENPYFKPDPCPDYLLSIPYVGDCVFFRRSSLVKIGGLSVKYSANFIYDALLRLTAEKGFACIAHIPDILYRRHPIRTLKCAPENRLIETLDCVGSYVKTTGANDVQVIQGSMPGSIRLKHALLADSQIRIITEAAASVAEMEAILDCYFLKRHNENTQLTILVTSNAAAEVINFLYEVDAAAPAQGLEVFQLPATLSFLQGADALIKQCNDQYIVLLRAGTLSTDSQTITSLCAELQRPGLGVVAPRVIDRQGNLIGNALILGCQGVAAGFGRGMPHSEPGHFGRLAVPQNPSAVTFDGISFRKSLFSEIGGFNLDLDPTCCAIDFCQKVRAIGQRIMWTPELTLIAPNHHIQTIEDSSAQKVLQSWLPNLVSDPFYNRNLSRQSQFLLTEKPQAGKLRLPWKPTPRLLAFPGDNMGCGHYRVIEPLEAAIKAGKVDGYWGFDHYNPYDLGLFEADTLYLQRQLSDEQLETIKTYRQFFKSRFIFELDDLITNLPVENIHKAQLLKDMPKRLRSGLKLCDRFIVSTQALADVYRNLHDDIRVVPNRIDIDRWGHLSPRRGIGNKPRVGWAGGLSHAGDLAEIQDVVKELADEVDWIFLGMCPPSIRPYVKEFHIGVDTPLYPAKLASLNLDLAIAPIAHNDFNVCKSNLKLLEYGALGYPVIATDFGPYRCGLPVELVKNRARDWMKAIREHINNPEESSRRGDQLKQAVIDNWILQDHLGDWCDAWFNF